MMWYMYGEKMESSRPDPDRLAFGCHGRPPLLSYGSGRLFRQLPETLRRHLREPAEVYRGPRGAVLDDRRFFVHRRHSVYRPTLLSIFVLSMKTVWCSTAPRFSGRNRARTGIHIPLP